MSNHDSTILVDPYRRAASAAAGPNSYRGLRIHALCGLHEFLADLMVDHLDRGTTVLDVAAGSGAMSARLRDLGYQVHACDYVEENFRLEDVPFTRLDLNEDFSSVFAGQAFQTVLASEIVEHLENPRHFFRQCNRILEVGGHLVLSTPNLHNSGSIASFVRTGQFAWFSDAEYGDHGHITPITQWQMSHCIREAGFAETWTGSFGIGATRLDGSPRLKLFARVLDRLAGIPRNVRGEIYVCIAQKVSAVPRAAA